MYKGHALVHHGVQPCQNLQMLRRAPLQFLSTWLEWNFAVERDTAALLSLAAPDSFRACLHMLPVAQFLAWRVYGRLY